MLVCCVGGGAVTVAVFRVVRVTCCASVGYVGGVDGGYVSIMIRATTNDVVINIVVCVDVGVVVAIICVVVVVRVVVDDCVVCYIVLCAASLLLFTSLL